MKKSRVGIVTIVDMDPNYGNKLQNYAVATIYRELGYMIETILTEPQINVMKTKLKIIINKCSGYRLRPIAVQIKWKKQLLFYDFTMKYLEPQDSFLRNKLNVGEYSFFSVGSDQVWNPTWYTEKKEEAFLLKFCDDSKKIAFSPSIGLTSIPDEWKTVFSEYIGRIKKISVREDAGANIIKQLTDREATVLVDPTMLLSAETWSRIERKPTGFHKENYVLTYFLSPKCNMAEKQLLELENYMNVYEILEHTDLSTSDIGPQEFIYLFSH